MLNLLKLIPTKLLTQTAGSLANQKLPAPLLQKFIQFYCKIYSILSKRFLRFFLLSTLLK